METRFDQRYFVDRRDCPVCGSAHVEQLYASPLAEGPVRDLIESHYAGQGTIDWACLEGTDYVLSDCADCRTIFQRHAPNPAMMDIVYNVMIAPEPLEALENKRLTLDNFGVVAGELAGLFATLGREPHEVRFLDYGMGHARWARVAVAMGARVFATEISPAKVALARSLGVEVVDEADLVDLRFDIVHTEQVFEHLPDPDVTFARLARCLAPGGLLKVSVPPQGDVRRLIREVGMISVSPMAYLWNPNPETRAMADTNRDFVSVLPLEHLNAFSPEAFAALGARNGLEIRARSCRSFVLVDPLSRSGLLRSPVKVAKAALRPSLRQDPGYVLYAAPAR